MDERIAAVLGALQLHTTANLQDAFDLASAAHAAEPNAPEFTAEMVVSCIEAIAREYKPSERYPRPRPRWFIDRIPGFIHHAVRAQRQKAPAADLGKLDREGLIALRDSGRASPEELAYCEEWIERLGSASAAG
jgi:hypothetical protein